MPLFDEARGRFMKVVLGDRRSCYKHGAVIRQLGFDPEDFADKAKNDRAQICAISALSYMVAERWLRQTYGPVEIPEREGSPGPRCHLVTADSSVSAPRGGNMSIKALSEAGVHSYLSGTSHGINWGDADKGLKMHLADATHGDHFDYGAAIGVLRRDRS